MCLIRPLILCLAVATAPALGSELEIRDASWANNLLTITLRFAPAERVDDALDAAVPICFRLRTEPAQRLAPICLQYAPLRRRYALRIGERETLQVQLRAELYDAFEDLRLPLASAPRRVRIDLARALLPAAMRLPAALQDSWQIDSGWQPVRLP